MTLPTGSERDVEQAKQLLEEYCFDLSGFQTGELVAIWQERLEADASWIRSAVLEALYQGRYKAFSVEQILQGWKRRGHPVRHFNSEFERVVFGPIDPGISKYAPMTTLSPSELMSPQMDARHQKTISANSDDPDSQGATLPFTTASAEPDKAPSPDSALSESFPDPSSASNRTVAEPKTSPPLMPEVPATEATIAPLSNAPYSSTIFAQPEPIRQFVPQSEASDFYYRLQSVARYSE